MESYNASTIMQQLCNIKSSPRFSLMLALSEGVIQAPFDGASIENSCTIEWIARDTSKPGKLLYLSCCMHGSYRDATVVLGLMRMYSSDKPQAL